MSDPNEEYTPHAKRMRTVYSVDALIRLVREEADQNNANSLSVLAYVAETSTRELNRAVDELIKTAESSDDNSPAKLEDLKNLTRTLESWPELWPDGTGKKNQIKNSEKRRDALEIGSESTVNLIPVPKLNRTKPQHIVARNLLRHMHGRRKFLQYGLPIHDCDEEEKKILQGLDPLTVSSAKKWFLAFWRILCKFTNDEPWREVEEPHEVVEISLHEVVSAARERNLNKDDKPINIRNNSRKFLWATMWAAFVRALPEDVGCEFLPGIDKKGGLEEIEEQFRPPLYEEYKKYIAAL
jgi:hypothetical protein